MFNSFTFSVEGMDEWIQKSGIRAQFSDNYKSVTVQYSPLDNVEMNLSEELKLIISFRSKLPTLPCNLEATIKQKSFFTIRSQKPLHLDKFIDIAYRICILLCLAIDEIVSIDNVNASSDAIKRELGEGSSIPLDIPIYYRSQPYLPKAPDISWHRMLFIYPHIASNTESFFKSWMANYEKLGPAIDLYIASKSTRAGSLTNQFIALAQGLEALHRRISNETPMPKSTFKGLIDELISNCPNGLKTWLRNKAKYGNELTLRKRIQRLFESFGDTFGDNRQQKRLATRIVDTRNYFTHFDESLHNKAAHGKSLVELVYIMEVLSQLHFLKLLGFSKDKIQTITMQNHRIRSKLDYSI